jgi:hypothetical protein
MKKPSFCAIALATIIGILAFSEIKDTITGDKSIFIVRWLYRSPAYAKNIEVQAYLLNDNQVLELLSHPEKDIVQPPQKDLYLKNVNVVLRIKNHGSATAWGTLAWRLGDQGWSKFDIGDFPPVHAKNAKRLNDYIIPVGVVVPFNNDLPPEEIGIKWDSLYRYR